MSDSWVHQGDYLRVYRETLHLRERVTRLSRQNSKYMEVLGLIAATGNGTKAASPQWLAAQAAKALTEEEGAPDAQGD